MKIRALNNKAPISGLIFFWEGLLIKHLLCE